MLYSVTFRTTVFQILTWFLRQPLTLQYIYGSIKPLQELNDNGTLVRAFGEVNPSLRPFQFFISDFLKFGSRTIYLEKWLNRFYDPVLERIRIINNNQLPFIYLFNTSEQEDPVYFYNSWDAAIAYIASPEDYVVHESILYVAIQDNTNQQPPNSLFWQPETDTVFLFNLGESVDPDYTVRVPLSVTFNPEYSIDRIIAQINLFNALGRTFEIQVI